MDTNLRNTQVDQLISKQFNMKQRKITNLPPAVNSSDAATLGDVKKAIAASQVSITSTGAGYLGPTAQSIPGRSLGSVYHNASNKAIWVTVTIASVEPGGTVESVNAIVDSNSSPSTIVASISIDTPGASTMFVPMTFVVIPNYYYKVAVSSGSPALSVWTEWS